MNEDFGFLGKHQRGVKEIGIWMPSWKYCLWMWNRMKESVKYCLYDH